MNPARNLKKFFAERVATTPRPRVPPKFEINGPIEDSDEIISTASSVAERPEPHIGTATGQSFIIEYVDAKGNESRRDITVWDLKKGSQCPELVGKCHLRNATRTFRLDRILTVIDYDGVVHDSPAEFFIETFGMAPELAKTTGAADRAELRDVKRQNQIRRLVLNQANLLAALSRSDGNIDPTEVGIILDHCVVICAAEGIEFKDVDLDVIGRYLRRLRPDEFVALECLDHLLSSGPDAINAFLRTSIKLIDADGIMHENERQMINQFAEELTGIPIP